MKYSELLKEGKYVYRYKHVGFYGSSGPVAPQRKGDGIDSWDKIFNSKAEYDEWYKDLVKGLAELDQVMNYCKYFVRTNGNEGVYVRDGKEHKVNGAWDGHHIWGGALFTVLTFDYNLMDSFRLFLLENNWDEKNWFDLMDKYK